MSNISLTERKWPANQNVRPYWITLYLTVAILADQKLVMPSLFAYFLTSALITLLNTQRTKKKVFEVRSRTKLTQNEPLKCCSIREILPSRQKATVDEEQSQIWHLLQS